MRKTPLFHHHNTFLEKWGLKSSPNNFFLNKDSKTRNDENTVKLVVFIANIQNKSNISIYSAI